MQENVLQNILNGDRVNYTVPQRLNVSAVDDKLNIFLRVNNVYHDKKLVVKCNDTILAEFKKRHLAPSEMEKIILNKNILEKIDGDITVSLKDC